MKKLLLSTALILSSLPLMAGITLNSYDVDSIELKDGSVISSYDLQDGYESIEGVKADHNSIILDMTKAKRVRSIRLLGGDSGGGGTVVFGIGSLHGGDMGGGGL